jgi:hypothetical protein
MFTKSSSASEDIALGNASSGATGRMVIHVVGASWTGTLTPRGRVAGSGAALSALQATKRSDDTAVSSISADGIYAIDASGLDVVLTHARTAGSVTVYAQPVVGS